jgi:hypothetical protein
LHRFRSTPSLPTAFPPARRLGERLSTDCPPDPQGEKTATPTFFCYSQGLQGFFALPQGADAPLPLRHAARHPHAIRALPGNQANAGAA